MQTEQIESQVNSLENLKEQFDSIIGPKWQDLQLELGQFFIEAEERLGSVLFRHLGSWIKIERNIPDSTQKVCMQLAKEEVEPEVAAVLPHSIVKSISKKNMPVWNNSYIIYSPNEGKVVTKKFKQFTKEERKLNIGPHGVKSINQATTAQEKPLQNARASSYRIEDGNLIIVVNSLRKEITLSINDKLLKDIKDACNAKNKNS